MVPMRSAWSRRVRVRRGLRKGDSSGRVSPSASSHQAVLAPLEVRSIMACSRSAGRRGHPTGRGAAPVSAAVASRCIETATNWSCRTDWRMETSFASRTFRTVTDASDSSVMVTPTRLRATRRWPGVARRCSRRGVQNDGLDPGSVGRSHHCSSPPGRRVRPPR